MDGGSLASGSPAAVARGGVFFCKINSQYDFGGITIPRFTAMIKVSMNNGPIAHKIEVADIYRGCVDLLVAPH
jgi:hypothetical protein